MINVDKIKDAYNSNTLYWSVLKKNEDNAILSVTEPFTDEGSISVIVDVSKLNDYDYIFSCIKEVLKDILIYIIFNCQSLVIY